MSKKEIDPRGPRFGAIITSILLLTDVYLAWDLKTFPLAVSLLSVITALFAIGAIFGNSKHPYGYLFKRLIRPLLQAPKELEDSRPPQFAQLIGLICAGIALAFGFLGEAYQLGLIIAVSATFFASFLNAAFNYCLGCQIWLGLARAGIIKA
ncbi:MAG: DUF4395 family protein [Actinobacteria bacterium]|jgi:hypothetical protein|uniref:Unannotated protein n=1 Tax=freshwater metagenome TaxID=449393 RepID=A0A6J6HJX6_9ZZZZ|nr:DUF4395 family protein [Actinomycetota bacterium]MTA29886.1 DUF4395 family protein [Actinomycetota bacterium]